MHKRMARSHTNGVSNRPDPAPYAQHNHVPPSRSKECRQQVTPPTEKIARKRGLERNTQMMTRPMTTSSRVVEQGWSVTSPLLPVLSSPTQHTGREAMFTPKIDNTRKVTEPMKEPFRSGAIGELKKLLYRRCPCGMQAGTFRLMDEDSDGLITVEDLETGLKKINLPDRGTDLAERVMAQMDFNGDRSIEYSEWAEWIELDQPRPEPKDAIVPRSANPDLTRSQRAAAREMKNAIRGKLATKHKTMAKAWLALNRGPNMERIPVEQVEWFLKSVNLPPTKDNVRNLLGVCTSETTGHFVFQEFNQNFRPRQQSGPGLTTKRASSVMERLMACDTLPPKARGYTRAESTLAAKPSRQRSQRVSRPRSQSAMGGAPHSGAHSGTHGTHSGAHGGAAGGQIHDCHQACTQSPDT